MENKVVNLQINDNLNETTKSVGNLKTQLRQAQNEVNALSEKFGATSREAVEAAKRAGELKDKIGDAKALTDAFNPDAKFKSLSASLGGVASGFAAYQGALGLIGVESKEVEAQILKVQSAMAIAQGAQAVGESVDAFKQLGAVVKSYSIVQKLITAGQWLWNAAMTANPLGAIVLAITAVIAAGYGLIKFFGNVATTSKVAMQGIKENSKALEDSKRITEKHNQALKDSADYNLAMAKASGKSAAEIRKLSITEANADISLKALNRTIAQNTYYRELNSLANLKASGATEEAIKMQDELTKKSLENFANENKALTESVRNRKLLIQKNNVEIRQEETDHRTKSNDDAKAAKTKKEEDAKAEAKRLKEEKAKAVISEAESFRNQLEAVEKVESDAKKANADALLSEQELAIQNENIAYQAKLDNAIKFGTSKEEIEKQHWNNLNNINLTARDKQKEIDKTSSDKDLEFQKNKDSAIAASKQNLNNIISGLETSGLNKSKAGQAISKSIALTQIGIDSAVAISKASTLANAEGVAAQLAFPLVPGIGTIARVVSYASTAASVIGNIARARQLLSSGGSGGGGGASTSGGSPTSTGGGMAAAPQFNVVGQGGANQLAQTMGSQKQEPIKAYVTAGDVTTGQSLNRNIINNASMG